MISKYNVKNIKVTFIQIDDVTIFNNYSLVRQIVLMCYFSIFREGI